MLTYDWIVMISLGKTGCGTHPRPLAPHEIELEEARRRHEARQAVTRPAPGLLQRLFSRRRAFHLPQPPRRARPQRQA